MALRDPLGDPQLIIRDLAEGDAIPCGVPKTLELVLPKDLFLDARDKVRFCISSGSMEITATDARVTVTTEDLGDKDEPWIVRSATFEVGQGEEVPALNIVTERTPSIIIDLLAWYVHEQTEELLWQAVWEAPTSAKEEAQE